MNEWKIRNQRIIEAVIEKEKKLCPGSVALIGIYGSFLTGDLHPLSDLDLLILINDDRGWQLGTAFIQKDLGIGHDIYCTTWEALRRDAEYGHPHISKLMDSRIVHCADEKYMLELEALREKVRRMLAEPFGQMDCRRAGRELEQARQCFALAMTADNLTDVRRQAGGVLYYAENALALLNKTYFRLGVRRRYEELLAMNKRPDRLCEMLDGILCAEDISGLKAQLTLFMKEMGICFEQAEQSVRPGKKQPDADTLSGTYEEMVSNWHGKMVLAAETGDRHLAFTSLSSLDGMMADIAEGAEIGPCSILSAYDPHDLKKTAEGFDRELQNYLKEYRKAGLKVREYVDVDSFVSAYLSDLPG